MESVWDASRFSPEQRRLGVPALTRNVAGRLDKRALTIYRRAIDEPTGRFENE